MTPRQLDDLWFAYVATGRDPEDFICLRTEAGDQIIQSMSSGEQWERTLESREWVRILHYSRRPEFIKRRMTADRRKSVERRIAAAGSNSDGHERRAGGDRRTSEDRRQRDRRTAG